MYTHTHIHTSTQSLCTRNRHSFTAIPESNLLHSVHSHLAIVSHRSTDNNKILVLSVVYLRVYLFVVILYSYFLRSVPPSIYSLQTTSIWSPCIVIRFPEVSTYDLQFHCVRSLATKAQNIRETNSSRNLCFFFFPLSFDGLTKDRSAKEYLEREFTNSSVSSKVRREIRDSSVG